MSCCSQKVFGVGRGGPWCTMGRLGSPLRVPWVSLGGLQELRGSLGDSLGSLGGPLGSLGVPGGSLEGLCGSLGFPGRSLGRVLWIFEGPQGALVGFSLLRVGPPRGSRGSQDPPGPSGTPRPPPVPRARPSGSRGLSRSLRCATLRFSLCFRFRFTSRSLRFAFRFALASLHFAFRIDPNRI